MKPQQLTITRFGTEKTVNYTNKRTGKPDSFNKIGFLTQEYGDRWFDFTFRGQHGLMVGTKREFEVSEREYNGKTYYEAKLPKQSSAPSGDLLRVERKIDAILTELQMMRGLLITSKSPTDLFETSAEREERLGLSPELRKSGTNI